MDHEQNYFSSIFHALPGPCIVIRPSEGRFMVFAVNDAYLDILGQSRETIVGKEFMSIFSAFNGSHSPLIPESVFDWVCQEKKAERVAPVFYPAFSLNGQKPAEDTWLEVTHTPVLNKSGDVEFIIRTLKDVTDAMRREELVEKRQRVAELDRLLAVEREVLALNATLGIPLASVLTAYLNGIQELFPDMFCSVMRARDGFLRAPVAPSISAKFLPADLEVPIAEGAGSCGTAAHRKRLVVANDIATDPIWEGPRALALEHGLRACWSYPIMDAKGQVLAVVGMYYKKPRWPTLGELDVIQRMADLLHIIFENNANAELIAQNNETMNQVQRLARFGIWQWDVTSNEVFWSDVLYDIFGVDPAHFVPSLETHHSFVVDADRPRVMGILEHVRTSGRDVVFEECVARPDGEVRHLRTWAKLLGDTGNGHPKVVGACLDITAIRSAETELKAIAWMQSHIIRAPVARIMGVVELMRHYPAHGQATETLLDSIYRSADELDGIIKEIARKAEQGKRD